MSPRRKPDRPFVKAADTEATVPNSRNEVEKILRRYGAVGISVAQAFDGQQRAERVTVEFLVPNSGEKDAPKVPVRIPVDVRRVYDALYGQPKRSVPRSEQEIEADRAAGARWPETYRRVHNPDGYDTKQLAQAERVAWRNLVLWLDATLSAATLNMQSITETFMAHTLIADERGQTMRMADYLERTQGALAPGVRALLTSSVEPDA